MLNEKDVRELLIKIKKLKYGMLHKVVEGDAFHKGYYRATIDIMNIIGIMLASKYSLKELIGIRDRVFNETLREK